MKIRIVLISYLISCWIVCSILISELMGLFGVPLIMNRDITLKVNQTFDHGLFLLSDIQNGTAQLYTVNDTNYYFLNTKTSIEVKPGSDFTGSISAIEITPDQATLHLDLHRDRTGNVAIGFGALLCIIPCYLGFDKLYDLWRRFTHRKDSD